MAARFFMSTTRALSGVLVPIYLALLGMNGLELGLLFLAVGLVSAVLSYFIGTSSDRIGRRPFLIALPVVAGAAALVYAFTDQTAILFIAAAAGTFGRGSGAGAGAVGPYQPAESAFVTDSIADKFRNDAFSKLTFLSSAGALAGGLLAMLAGSGHPHHAHVVETFRPGFIAAGVFAIVAGLIAIGIREGRAPTAAGSAGSRKGRPRLPVRSRPLLYRLWATNTANGLAIGMLAPFVTYWLYRRYGVGAGDVGALFAIVNLVSAFSSLYAARLANRFGTVKTISVVRAAQALLLIPLVLAPTFLLAGVVYLVRMLIQRIQMPLRQSYVVGMADPAERGSVAALANTPSQVAMSASPVLAGYLFDEVNLSIPFEVASGLQLVNAGLFWLFFRKLPPPEERTVASMSESVPAD